MKYAFDNQDKTVLEKLIPGTINELSAFDSELQGYGLEVTGIRTSDTTYEHLCLNVEPDKEIIVQEESRRLYAIPHTDINMNIIPFQNGLHKINSLDIERGIFKAISSTCSCCGAHHTVAFRSKDPRYELQEQFYLCDYCHSINSHIWDGRELIILQSNFYKVARIANIKASQNKPAKVRILNPEGSFDYTHTDCLSEFNGQLYMLTNRSGYQSYDVSVELGNQINDVFPAFPRIKDLFIVKVRFAGVELRIRDIHGERIYSGDILSCPGKPYYGMAIQDPVSKLKCGVYHGPDAFPTLFEDEGNWEIVGNIILNNNHYTGDLFNDYCTYYDEHKDYFRSLAGFGTQ